MKLDQFRLERYFARHEFSAPYLLCSSDCESMELGELLAFEPGAHERLMSMRLGYTESLGSPELRQAIAALYEHITAEQVLVHAGAEEAIFNFMNVALGPGDHVIVHAPYYQSLGEVARGVGAEVTEWRGDPKRAWELDLLDPFFDSHGAWFAWDRPRAGSIAFPILLNQPVDAFCADLVRETGVLLLPGTLYGSGYNAFRIGFGRKNLPESLDRLETYIRSSGKPGTR